MKIKEFIQNELLLPRLKSALALVVYDPDRRYRELCLELVTDKRIVIDASESSIESREAALATLRKLGEPHSLLEWMLVYVPAKRPERDDQREVDPFALYEACGAAFPKKGDD